jgi:ribonuclease P protein component
MLPKQNRLKKKNDFEKVFKKGKGFRQGFLFFKIAKNNLKESRFGFIVSKQVSKKAVIRNKIKRRLRKLVQLNLLKIKTGIDGVLIVKPGLETKNFLELENLLNKLFKKAKLFNS